MPMSVTYTTFNGRIVSENRGGVIRNYVSDAEGNTIALTDDTGTVTDTWTYWPYGEVQKHTGTSTTPFTFGGVFGVFSDSATQGYARARIVRYDLTRWMTVDPLWPFQPAYVYAHSNPVTFTDPSGLQAIWFPGEHLCKGDRRRPLGDSPISISPGPCSVTDVLQCSMACRPLWTGGQVQNVNGECFCYCYDVPEWIDCSFGEILQCIASCNKFGHPYDFCRIPVGSKFSLKACHCKNT